MSANTISIAGVRMSLEASQNVEDLAVDVATELRDLRAGRWTREQGWHDYVDAIMACVDARQHRINGNGLERRIMAGKTCTCGVRFLDAEDFRDRHLGFVGRNGSWTP